jgi:hypothetical protein
LTPATPVQWQVSSNPVPSGLNTFTGLTLPLPASFAPLDPALGISDFGPFPANMTGRNQFRGPGAWNADMAVQKKFKLTERLGLDFRAEGFDVFHHHNYYVNTTNLYSPQPHHLYGRRAGLNSWRIQWQVISMNAQMPF